MADNSAVRIGSKARPAPPLRKINENDNDDRHDDDPGYGRSVGHLRD